MEISEIISTFEKLSNPDEIEGMKRFGIGPDHAYGLRMPVIKKIAKNYKNYREPKILTSLIDDSKEVTSEQWINGLMILITGKLQTNVV